ncbi:MAG: hypothetical protein ACYS0K_23130 [Planctomycetota bacterium]
MTSAGDESTLAPDALGARYEELRDGVRGEGTWGGRLGLALLLREGVAAWMEAWRLCPDRVALPPSPAGRDGDLWSDPSSADVVRVLANMALGGVGRRTR